jgi:integrase
MRYQSGFDIQKLIQQAQEELPVEQFKIFLLASMAGLRRNEIDKLLWEAFRWDNGLIRIGATAYFHPKSEDSIGDVEVDAELLEVFRGYRARATGEFVIESSVAPKAGTGYSHYRCQELFDKLVQWLRAHGVDTTTPLHTLRKEFGSQICARDGIYAASTALRHADIAITSQHYLDKKKRVTVGLGNLLNPPSNILPLLSRPRQMSRTKQLGR